MTRTDSLLTEALVKRGSLSREALDGLLKEAKESSQSLAAVLISRELIPEQDILNILARELKLSSVDIKTLAIDKSLIEKVPLRIASYYKFLPLELNGRALSIAVAEPLEVKTQDEIRTQLGYDIEVVLALSGGIQEGLKKYYGIAAGTLERISPASSPGEGLAAAPGSEIVEDIEKLAGEATVINLVNQIILEGWKKRATDIHLEPYRQGITLRYRVDGLLYDAALASEMKGYRNAIISRIKIMSNLNIVERRIPQDGKAVVKVAEQMLDLRISTIPTPFGESLVIRILPTQMLFSLEKLGLGKKDLQIFEALIQKPHGIIFVTGPTGSGKTTTLYTCLSRINTRERKIISIEDPIEYEIPGVTQIQVMPEVGLDFARGLRSILRHDPDVIMVGEVRDLETAEIAIRVALTGHLIFSTLHTNDAASGVTRLIDIGVEPYLVSSSVEAFIAQRLLRLLCNACKYEDKQAPRELKEMIARDIGLSSAEIKIFRGKGCASCNFTGFFGRAAIYEILLLDEELRALILKKTPSGQLKKIAISKGGMRTLRQDGWQKVILGLTTPEEVMKATSAEESSISHAPEPSIQRPALVPLGGLEEKRTYRRLDKQAILHYKVFHSQEELLKQGYRLEQLNVTKNISAGGLLFTSAEAIAIGSILELKIELPEGGEPIECLSRAVRLEEREQNKNYDIAACFLDVTSAQRARLDKYIETKKD